ncbi:uncharacterized protein IL334_005835 [Kwoniella shivajii]|uniref:Uncharacterized protein n=1 Tax=Kwoniella shivajii TaxID=564305 RepID=A0ABZ1D6B3_9TREE|nr:hypothetical protein IL334_005835 [Kwoniella shivajii]
MVVIQRRFTPLLIILPLLVQGRKYEGDNYDNYNGDNGDELVGDSRGNGAGIHWISPSLGDSIPSGQALTVTWSSENPVTSPSIALCTSSSSSSSGGGGGGGGSDDCGNANWPSVIINGDGTYSATVTMPVISQSMQGLYLSMISDNGKSFNSPNFAVQGGSGSPNAYLASPTVSTLSAIPTTLPAESMGIQSDDSVSTAAWKATTTGGTVSVSMTTRDRTAATPSTKKVISSTSLLDPTPTLGSDRTPTSLALPLYSTTQIQVPLQAISPTPTPLSGNVIADQQAAASSPSSSNKPKITAIALPLSLCGLILIASLIFCARSKVFRKSGLGKNVDPENSGSSLNPNWQDVIKQKAASTCIPTGIVLSKGVEVIERKDDVEFGHDQIPTLGYNGRQPSLNPFNSQKMTSRESDTKHNRSNHSRQSRNIRDYDVKDGERRFTDIPQIHYDRSSRTRGKYRGRGDRDGEYERQQQRRHAHRYDRGDSYYSERSRDGHSSRQGNREKDYYSISRRSSGGIGGLYDNDPYSSRDSNRNDRSSTSSHSRSRYDEGINSNTRELISPRRPSFTILDLHQNDSYVGPLDNPHDRDLPLNSHPKSDGRKRRPLPNPQSQPRPQPQPIIRSSTQSSVTESELLEMDMDMPRQKTLPHLSGGLRDDHSTSYCDTSANRRSGSESGSGSGSARKTRHCARDTGFERERSWESDTESGWDLANQGGYKTGEEGMGELYESLRRAIQRG